jgi:TonB family protein
MGKWTVAAVAALALCGQARADDDADSHKAWISPENAELRQRWPKGADGALLYGQVTFDCAVGADGHATDCRVKSSDPSNPALAEGVSQLTSLYAGRSGNTARSTLVSSLHTDTDPDWLKKPSFDDMVYAWPRAALASGTDGRVTLDCTVNKQGFLQDCSPEDEAPTGEGFGEAALALIPTMLFKPATRNGQPVEAEVTIPINFHAPHADTLPNIFVLPRPTWAKTPDTAAVLAQLDKKVGDKFADGKIVMMCTVNKPTGKLRRCKVVNSSQGMDQFANVSKALADDFQADSRQLQEWPDNANARVFVPFSFPDMASAQWSKRYLNRVVWTYIPGPRPGHPLFPAAAVQAGFKQGMAKVDCAVANDGRLNDCLVTEESVPGVGFGITAKTMAEASFVNPWTEEGLPAGGARVRVPIQMKYDPATDAPPPDVATPAPAAKP